MSLRSGEGLARPPDRERGCSDARPYGSVCAVTVSTRLRRILALVLALLVASGFLVAPAAASGWSLKASGSGTITTAQSRTLSVSYTRDGRAVARATVQLQRKVGTEWVAVTNVTTGPGGRATARVAPNNSQVYRFRTARAVSNQLTVTVVPATFTISGSGSGHGVGMSQWGAYRMARTGSTAKQILEYYYQGAAVSTATRAATSLSNDAVATIKVQVLGPPSDSRTTTRLSVGSGAWRLRNAAGTQVATGRASQPVTIGVTSTGVKATFTSSSGTVTKSSSTLYFEWTGTRYYQTSGTKAVASVLGAQGTYRNGRLEVKKVSGRPNVVNQVVLNTEYLYGLDEMPSGWGTSSNGGAAALQAQAVAARTYAITEKTSKGLQPACGCHVYDDTRSQNYTGWRKQGGSYGSTWVAAVNATVQATTVSVLREPAAIGSGFAETPYFASSGKGTSTLTGTANNSDAFGTAAVPYLVHKPDPYSAAAPGNPYVSWSDSITQVQAQRIFGLSAVRSIAVTSRFSSGQLHTVTATAPNGARVARTKTAEGWRTALGLTGSWVVSFRGR